MEDGENAAKRLWNGCIREKSTILMVKSWEQSRKLLEIYVFKLKRPSSEKSNALTLWP